MIKDVRVYIQRLQKLAFAPKTVAAVGKPLAAAPDFSQWGPVRRQSLTPLRNTISRRMLENWNTIPHVTQFDEADVTLIRTCGRNTQQAYESKGVRLTVTAFILKAIALTLQEASDLQLQPGRGRRGDCVQAVLSPRPGGGHRGGLDRAGDSGRGQKGSADSIARDRRPWRRRRASARSARRN